MRAKEFLTEDQVLRFNDAGTKKDIMKHIASVKKDGVSKPTGYDCSQVYYNVLRGANYQGGDRSTPEYQELSKNWETYFNHSGWQKWSGWAQYTAKSKDLNKKYDGVRIYNYYITVNDDLPNLKKTLYGFNDLISILQELSRDYHTMIQFKTHDTLENFINDNDRIKIYYYETKVYSSIEKIVKSWAERNKISLGNRLYNHGVDTSDKSFGQLLATGIRDRVEQTVMQYKNYSDEEIFNLITNKLIPDYIKQVKIRGTTA